MCIRDSRYVFQKWEGALPFGTSTGDLSVVTLTDEDLTAAAFFLERELEDRFQVFPERTEEYLRTLQKEVASEGGGLAAVLNKEELAGVFSYWPGEEQTEIRELVADSRFLPDALRQGKEPSPDSEKRCV